jgi:hypothetical protein
VVGGRLSVDVKPTVRQLRGQANYVDIICQVVDVSTPWDGWTQHAQHSVGRHSVAACILTHLAFPASTELAFYQATRVEPLPIELIFTVAAR